MTQKLEDGTKVEFRNENLHKISPEFYPESGTIGTVVYKVKNSKITLVQWPEGSTSLRDRWYAADTDIRIAK